MKLKAICLIFLSGLFLSACSLEPSKIGLKTTTTIPTVIPTSIPEKVFNNDHIFSMINEYRKLKGVSELKKSDELCKLAEKRADYLVADRMKAYLASKIGGHIGLQKFADDYSGKMLGENIGGNTPPNFRGNPYADYSWYGKAFTENQDKEALSQMQIKTPQ